eukprot:GHVS01001983.1.p2 GENE.GHVS01001983.1~~GHVS01001983.1.p2  ORF type:complete len:152 (+),score=9.85 GHVS01001983.1:37-456(+)
MASRFFQSLLLVAIASIPLLALLASAGDTIAANLGLKSDEGAFSYFDTPCLEFNLGCGPRVTLQVVPAAVKKYDVGVTARIDDGKHEQVELPALVVTGDKGITSVIFRAGANSFEFAFAAGDNDMIFPVCRIVSAVWPL